MDLPYEARIAVHWQAHGDLEKAVEEHAAHIAKETLASTFEHSPAPEGADHHDSEVDGVLLHLGITPAN